jgi:hypothetical protein
MSRVQLADEEIIYLLKAINKQGEQDYRLKISNDFDSLLAEFEDDHLEF